MSLSSEVRNSCQSKVRSLGTFRHFSAKLELNCQMLRLFTKLRTLFWQETLTSEFRKVVATCFLDPIFSLESDVEVHVDLTMQS